MTARSSAEEFWPFLISRGHVTTYRVVVAPQFLCEADLAGLLYDLAGVNPPHRAMADTGSCAARPPVTSC